VFRPLPGWATAWSFDRLRRWLEHGLEPEAALRQAAAHAVARSALGLVWIYQGLVPKLLAPEDVGAAVRVSRLVHRGVAAVLPRFGAGARPPGARGMA
jgi:hypothetical protein